MATFNAGDIEATATLERTPFQRSLEAAIREGRSFAGTTWTANLDVDYRQVDRKLNLARAKLDQFAGKKYTAKIDADRAGVTRAVEAAKRQLDSLGGGGTKNFRFNADLDNSPVLRKLAEIESAANRTADSIGSGFSSSFQKLKIGAILGGVTLGAAAAGPTLIGLAGGFGAAAVSAHGLGDALQAYTKDQKNSDKVAASGASTAHSNAVAIRNAQEAIQDARRQAGRAAEDAGERVAQAAKAEIRAAQDVVEAQKAIASARREATRALEDAQEKVNDFALDLNGAILAQRRAAEDLTKTNNDSSASDLDRAEAQQRLAEAIERVNDLTDEHKRDTEDLASLQAKGIEGSDQVTNATKQQADAESRLQEAMHESAIARRDAQRSQEDSARAIARAEQNLRDTMVQQGEAAGAAAAKNDDFADALNKLSPAGQKMVRTLLSLKDNYDRLTSETQGAVFPGLMRMLDALPDVEYSVTAGFKAIGGAISDVGDHAAETIKNPLFQGQLQQSLENGAPIVRAIGNAVIDLGADMVKFGSTSAPIVGGIVDAFGSLENGVDRFFTNIQPESRAAGQTIASFGQIVEDVLGGAGTITGQFFSMWADARSHIEPVVREIIQVFTEFTGGGFSAFGDDMKIVLDVVNGALHVVEPFAKVLGGLAGDVLAANLAFKLFAGPVGKVVELFGKLKPANIAASITGSLPAFMRAGVEVDKTTGKITRNTDGLSKNQVAWGKVGGKVAEAGKYIPIAGLAIAAVSEYIDQVIPDLDNLAQGMLDGGQAAADAAGSFKEVRGAGVGFGDALRDLFGPSIDEAAAKAREMYKAMTPLQQAQQDNTKAANDYQYALKNFGAQSLVTREAAEKYRITTQDVKQAQYEAEQATKSHTEKIRDQQDAMLASAGSQISYERAQIRVKEAQNNLNTAIKEHGANSAEAKQAELDYRQAMLDSVTAAQSLADANNSLLSPTDQLNGRITAVNNQLVSLAVQAGTALPPELQSMINKMSDSGLAAYGVSVKVDEMGNKILSLPPGKELHFPNDAKQATDAMYGLGNAIGFVDRSYQGWMNSYINLIRTMINNPIPDGGTGLGTPAGFGFLGHKAYGGPLTPGMPTVVGEVGPELIFPDKASFVATAAASKAILNGVSVGSNGAARTDNTDVVEAIGALMALLMSGVRAEFDAGSLETGLIRAGRRRGTR